MARQRSDLEKGLLKLQEERRAWEKQKVRTGAGLRFLRPGMPCTRASVEGVGDAKLCCLVHLACCKAFPCRS